MDLRAEQLERQARLRASPSATGSRSVALGRAFYDRPGPCAWLTGHHPPFLAAAPQPGLRGAGHAAFVLPVAARRRSSATRPERAREDRRRDDEIWSTDDLWEGLVERAPQRTGWPTGPSASPAPTCFPRRSPPRSPASCQASSCAGSTRRSTRSGRSSRRTSRCCSPAPPACGCGLAAAIGLLRGGRASASLRPGAPPRRCSQVLTTCATCASTRAPGASARALASGSRSRSARGRARDGRRDRRVRGYAFDVARTILLGEGTPAQRRLLETCAAAADASAAACRDGVRGRRRARCRDCRLRGCGPRAYARTFAGHGIGIETVESPLLAAATAETRLSAGMALCVEPGIAIPDVGGALIEHELVVGPAAPRLLCATPSLS